ncbi:histone-like transcription factor (CBF/NF-Y) and archaeal histone domain-containing protein [Ditylenchus destructor]|uniref:Histone-like transcription factor (CBF/NF-Y) and archaeal histone domain-containing protein n=1 Tax=Ditylenchus destructor TaxID=166010 RepID=A0AAD4N3N1_9BILA|nr:histone-like transcription factor (CBF/NF-Y) and archaeal histone domain-containing protein [Ditylenchus destructor]
MEKPSGSGVNHEKALDDAKKDLREFWQRRHVDIRHMAKSSFREVNRHQELPLARIKKIMKIEEEVKKQMISAEAPILLAKAAELIIEELTLRSWIHTQENKRKTVQKSDIAMAVSRCEMFDFLIDIVPREEIMNQKSRQTNPMEEGEGYFVSQPDVHQSQQPYPQFVVQYNGTEGDSQSATVMQLENGQIIQATPIGPSIPLSSAPGQPIQLITSQSGEFILNSST